MPGEIYINIYIYIHVCVCVVSVDVFVRERVLSQIGVALKCTMELYVTRRSHHTKKTTTSEQTS